MKQESKKFFRPVWAEKTACGEMWIGRYFEEASGTIGQTLSYGDHDTAILHARIEREKRRCTGYHSAAGPEPRSS
jgi:hypothetical protein